MPKRNKKPKGHRETFFTYPVMSHYRVMIVLTDSIRASVAYLSERDFFNSPAADELDDCHGCHIHPDHRGHSYLIFGPTVTAGSIAHECWHMVYQLSKWAGVEIEDEFVAYHLGYAVQKVVDFQHKNLRRKNDSRRTRP